MVLGPEQAKILKEFEKEFTSNLSDSESCFHHVEGFAAQKSFKEQTVNLIHVFNEL